LATTSGKLNTPLANEYVQTYDSLKEDKKKKIDDILLEKYEKDPKSTNETILKELEKENPKLQYKDKIAPELTETLDKNITPEVSRAKVTQTKDQPAASPSALGSSLGEAKAKQIQQNQEKLSTLIGPTIPSATMGATSTIENKLTPKQEKSLTPVITVTKPMGAPVSASEVEEQNQEEQEYPNTVPNIPVELPPGPAIKNTEPLPETTQQTKESFLSRIAKFGLSSALPIGGATLGGAAGVGGLTAMSILQNQTPTNIKTGTPANLPASFAQSASKGIGDSAISKIGTAGKLAIGTLFPSIGMGMLASNVAKKSSEKTEAGSEKTSSFESVLAKFLGKSPTEPTTKSEDQLAKISAEQKTPQTDLGSQPSKDEGILKTIAENTKSTVEQIGKLADAFTVFSKMLPGSLASMSSRSESFSPTIVTQGGSQQQNNKLRSTQIAKGGNPAIQNFRAMIEGNRPLPA
jgi:hypothetical protein